MSRTCKFARAIVCLTKNGKVAQTAHWYNFMSALMKHPNSTRVQITDRCKPVVWWDRYATNEWAAMVRCGYIEKTRHGRNFTYRLSEQGKEFFLAVKADVESR